jgi:hypothetical protein
LHFTQSSLQAADEQRFVERVTHAFINNTMIVEGNQQLLTELVHCVCAFVDGFQNHLDMFIQLDFRSKLLQYMGQANAPFTVELLRALSECLSVFVGHCTSTVSVDDNANTKIVLSEAQMSQTLQVTYTLLNTILNGGNLYHQGQVNEDGSTPPAIVDEPTVIHLITVYGLLLPLVPVQQLQNNCKPLFDQCNVLFD